MTDSESHGAPSLVGSLEQQIDDLVLLQILSALDDASLLAVRAVSRRHRELADVVLAEHFVARWGVQEVAAPPPAAPAYAAARPAAFVRCHALHGRESLASLAVRYCCDVTTIKRLNNLLSDHAMMSRDHLFVPVADAAEAAAGKRVAFVHDEHSKRRLIVIMGDGQELPAKLAGRGSGGRRSGADQAFVVARLAAVLQRALRIDQPTATFYVQQASCDVRAAIEKYEEDRRWERVMKHRKPQMPWL